MLGKQWLNRYASTDMRGTATERSQNRQRKLDGIITWYFDHVMEALPLMLQTALLLLGCALSRYLWGISITVASVVLAVTSAGIFFYIFIIVAGAVSESCPYQTPGSHALRYLWPEARKTIPSALRNTFGKSKALKASTRKYVWYHPWWSRGNIMFILRDVILEIPLALAVDSYRLGRAAIRLLVTFPIGVYRLVSVAVAPMVPQLHGVSSVPKQISDQQTMALDIRCISWMLQTSLDKVVHLSTLKHLATMTTLAGFDPTLVADCFNTFVGCIKVEAENHRVAVVQGLEQLATVSALCFFNTMSHLLAADPASSVLEDVRQRYIKVFSDRTDFRGHQFYRTMGAIHCLFIRNREHRSFQWSDYKPSADEHAMVARNFVKLAQFKYQKVRQRKVPRWILRFTLRSLSFNPLPPTSVIADCLSIIAIELGCNVSDTGITISDERCGRA